MQQVNSGTAYATWCLFLLGICGGQRFYTGNAGIGIIYLFTFGIFGIGQFIDLFLIPDMVEKRNLYLKGLHGNSIPNVNQSVTLNIGDIPQLKNLDLLTSGNTSRSVSDKTPMQKLLKAAKKNGGQLSLAQAAMHTDLAPEDIKKLLQEAENAGYAQIGNDPNTGAIRYFFDV
ncbi:MAG: TM2 domain-containing protein [Thermosynechococcaceae cyanobacterium]